MMSKTSMMALLVAMVLLIDGRVAGRKKVKKPPRNWTSDIDGLRENITRMKEEITEMGSSRVMVHVHGMGDDSAHTHEDGTGTHVHIHMHMDDPHGCPMHADHMDKMGMKMGGMGGMKMGGMKMGGMKMGGMKMGGMKMGGMKGGMKMGGMKRGMKGGMKGGMNMGGMAGSGAGSNDEDTNDGQTDNPQMMMPSMMYVGDRQFRHHLHSPDADATLYGRCNVAMNSKMTDSPHNIHGTIYFRQKFYEPLEALIHLKGFKLPEGDHVDHTMHMHGFHVHEFGDNSNGCNSFGGHYNPDGVDHASKTSDVRHAGDWGNIHCDDKGEVHQNMSDQFTSLVGPHSIVGRGIVIHDHGDDLGLGGNPESLKAGNAGSRHACCIIVWSPEVDWDMLSMHHH